MKQHGSKYFAHRPPYPPDPVGLNICLPTDLRTGSKGQNSTLPEHSHVAYQIKWNRECSNMQHIFSPYTHPRSLGRGQRSKYFSLKVVMLHIKLEGGMEYRALCKHMFCPYTHPRPPGAGLKSKHFFSESSHVACQIKRNET